MVKHDCTRGGWTRVREREDEGKKEVLFKEEVLETFDATPIVGLRTKVCNAAVLRRYENGEDSVELPRLKQLLASTSVARCLMPVRLRGWEIKAMRKIMHLTLNELAKKLDEKTATETLSRWESEAQPMGGYVEKLLRLLICEELSKDAPGVDYSASKIANMQLVDPWRVHPDYEVPCIQLTEVRVREQSGALIEAWDAKKAA